MKSLEELKSFLLGKKLDIFEIDEFMIDAGFESILPTDIELIANTGLIWYPFEPFLNQINIWVDTVDGKFRVEAVELFSDC